MSKSKTVKVWDPSRNEYTTWDGREVTPYREGHSQGPGPGHKVTPRLVGPAVYNFRRAVGCCPGLGDTCRHPERHEGECS